MVNPSEFRRVYMKRIVADIQRLLRVNPVEARLIASGMVALLEAKMKEGEALDLGFMRITPVTVPPREFKYNLNTENKGRTFQGESTKWKVRFFKSWLRKTRPRWSTKY